MPVLAPKRMFALFALGAWYAGAEPRIESFSPTGYAKDVTQVAVRFSEPMVALGDPETSDPFAVGCDVPGSGRWIDERNWVYDFAYDVPGAERCRFTLRRGVRTLTGERVTGPREHSFHTGGPNIIDGPIGNAHTRQRRIDERQVILMALDSIADEDSIREHVYCRIGRSRRVAAEVATGAERDEIIDALMARRTATATRRVRGLASPERRCCDVPRAGAAANRGGAM